MLWNNKKGLKTFKLFFKFFSFNCFTKKMILFLTNLKTTNENLLKYFTVHNTSHINETPHIHIQYVYIHRLEWE